MSEVILKKYKRMDSGLHCGRKGGADNQDWGMPLKELLHKFLDNEFVELPEGSEEYITNIKSVGNAGSLPKKNLSPKVGFKKKAETFKEVITGVKEEVTPTPKEESEKNSNDSKKPNRIGE